jgi:hypothetical protein
MTQVLFFAIQDDLLPVIELVESKAPLKYTLCGNFRKDDIEDGIIVYNTGAEIPDLGKPRYDSSVRDRYLVCQRDTPIDLGPVYGIDSVVIGQGANPDSVELSPGGAWNEDVVLSGRVATGSPSKASRALMRRFQAAIKKTFVIVGAYYVGPNALVLLKSGKRLTNAVQCPREYDLALEDESSRPKVSEESTGHALNQRRLPYDESICRLQELGFLAQDENPHMPDHVPDPESDESAGLSFFRTFVGDAAELSNLTIPRTFFGRSEISDACFRNTDLTESNLCWNDFTDVDFTEAALVRADLRASIYTRVNFTRADLRGADMRRADLKRCVFDDAIMESAILTRKQGRRLELSPAQVAVVDWRDDAGPEPSGG